MKGADEDNGYGDWFEFCSETERIYWSERLREEGNVIGSRRGKGARTADAAQG
jgi:hypothetical protein